MFFYFEVQKFAQKKITIMKKPCQNLCVMIFKPFNPSTSFTFMNTRIFSFGFALALAGALRLAAQTSSGFTAEVDGPWMRDFLIRHPEYKEVVTDGDFSTRVLITDPTFYVYMRETAPDKVGVARGLTPDLLREAREKALALRRTLAASDRPRPEDLRRHEAEARRAEEWRNRRPEAGDYAALSSEALAARLAELKEALRSASNETERRRLEEELRLVLHQYNQRINPSNPQ